MQSIIVHGGAGQIPPETHESHRRGCANAAVLGWQMLNDGGSALDAVEAAVRSLEDDPAFNAGHGAALTIDGEVELDAGIMSGATLKAGAVGALSGFANPISIARRLLEKSDHDLLVADGAASFALAQGFEPVSPASLITERQRTLFETLRTSAGPGDTVGALALDADDNIAAALSTGGYRFKWRGRVGDSPIPGAGLYAQNGVGAVACTGVGEHIMRTGLALRAMFWLEAGKPAPDAATAAIEQFQRLLPGGQAGLIIMDAQGGVGWAHSTPYLSYAYRTSADSNVAGAVSGA
ncbi:MAG: isoaspartyl peptidase/L-asparaginase [Caldilineales bacterium]|nr:isoaspartyl peptidase/L-asparaginase [Caldilineales bacterium]